MDANAKKTALRVIPYGLYVLTGESDGRVAAATGNALQDLGDKTFYGG